MSPTADYARDRLMPEGADPRIGIFSHIGAVALNGVHDARIRIGDVVAVFGPRRARPDRRAGGARERRDGDRRRSRSQRGARWRCGSARTQCSTRRGRRGRGDQGADRRARRGRLHRGVGRRCPRWPRRSARWPIRRASWRWGSSRARSRGCGWARSSTTTASNWSARRSPAPRPRRCTAGPSRGCGGPRSSCSTTGVLDLMPLITHTAPFAEAPALFERLDAGEPGVLQAMLAFG